MILTPEKSLCDKNQAIVVSRDRGNFNQHRATNPQRLYDLRHYKLDGDLVTQRTCCDYLLVNDSSRNAYLIELKGANIDKAVEQLEAGEQICRNELSGYRFFYRIVCNKVRTHKVESNKVRKFRDKYGERLLIREKVYEETL